MQLKGESSEPDAAIAQLMARIAAAVTKSGNTRR